MRLSSTQAGHPAVALGSRAAGPKRLDGRLLGDTQCEMHVCSGPTLSLPSTATTTAMSPSRVQRGYG
eukprot:9384929-Alexandrium_andersonii.AAC.1